MGRPTRTNNIGMLESTYSVVSGESDVSVHVWRVDMVTSSIQSLQTARARSQERSRVAGSTSIRTVNPQEGESLAVSHFNSSSASMIKFATQQDIVQSGDLLRCAIEPFNMRHSPELGHMTSMALGRDRHWIVTGTSKAFVALWGNYFQQCVKLWRHSRGAPISRMATSTVPPPQHWGYLSCLAARGRSFLPPPVRMSTPCLNRGEQ
jgi:phosphoinositide-3-kinase regulatory subunit 4